MYNAAGEAHKPFRLHIVFYRKLKKDPETTLPAERALKRQPIPPIHNTSSSCEILRWSFFSSISWRRPQSSRNSFALRLSYSAAFSGTYPRMRFAGSRSSGRVKSWTRILPLPGERMPARIFSVVLFPAPFAPASPGPRRLATEMSNRAGLRPGRS